MTITTTVLTTYQNETDRTVPKILTRINNKKENDIPSLEKYKFLFWEFETRVLWTNVIFITLWHVMAVYYFVTHNFLEKYGIVIYCLVIGGMGGFGVTAGAHRYFTHRCYKAKLPLRIILLFCYTLAGQNSLLDWVRDHRVHHKFSETDADPHNSKRGFFFSHVGWLMMKKHPEVIRKGRQFDFSDLFEDPLVAFHQKYYSILKFFIAFVLPSAIPPYLYGEQWDISIKAVIFVRYVVNLNATWSVNSAAHIWGNKPYDKRIGPVENLSVSIFAMGEGYHNYHHTFPWDYRAAELGSRVNITTFWLNVFQKIGWAYDLKAPSEDLVKRVIEKTGDGTHYRWGHEVPIEELDKIK